MSNQEVVPGPLASDEEVAKLRAALPRSIPASEPECPLEVRDGRGRCFNHYRDWALSLAQDEADEVSAIADTTGYVVDLRTGNVVYSSRLRRFR